MTWTWPRKSHKVLSPREGTVLSETLKEERGFLGASERSGEGAGRFGVSLQCSAQAVTAPGFVVDDKTRRVVSLQPETLQLCCRGGSAQGGHLVPPAADHALPFPAVTSASPMKTLYVMSDAKLSALTKSVMGEATSVPLKLPGIQPSSSSSSSSASSPTGAVTFATSPLAGAPSPPGSLVHPKVGPVLQTASKTVILTSTLAAVKGDGPLGHLGEKVSLSKSASALGHALGTMETLGRVPSVVDDGSTVIHTRETLANRHLLPQGVLPAGAGTTLITLGSSLASSSIIAAAGPTLSQKP